MEILTEWWGVREDISPLELAARALAMFGVLLFLVRVTGMRPFGKGSAIDGIVVILLGSILSKGVVGSTPFWSTVAGGVALMGAHKLFAFAAFKWRTFGRVVKGREQLLYQNGNFFEDRMAIEGISENDILEQLRIKTHFSSLDNISEVYFERNGEVSFVIKTEHRQGLHGS